MSEIVIKIELDVNNNITIINEENGNSFTISYSNKYISASSVYDVLSYKSGHKYRFEKQGIDEKTDDKVVKYFNEVVNMFEKICDEISNLKIKDPNEDINEIDFLDDERDDDPVF